MRSRSTNPRRFPRACETAHKLARLAAAVACALWIAGTPARAAQPPEPGLQAAGEAETPTEAHPWLDLTARLVNFSILAGSLWYLLRSPIGRYLNDRGTQIRADLVNAAETKQAAAAQIEEIDRKMKALPGELDALRRQGAQDMATEEQRIAAAADHVASASLAEQTTRISVRKGG